MDEYIKRANAIEAVRHAWAKGLEPVQYLEIIPATDVAPVRHGRWLDVREKRLFGEHYFLCSNCKSRNGLMIPFNYCPNCGTKMDGGDSDEAD